MNVEGFEGFDHTSTKPTLKTNLSDRLTIGPLKEDIYYRIVSINNISFMIGEDSPKVGESMALNYDFKPNNNSGFGYETLSLFIGRHDSKGIHNYVRYFKSIKDLENTIIGVEFELDTNYATKSIARLQKSIDNLRQDYLQQINTTTSSAIMPGKCLCNECVREKVCHELSVLSKTVLHESFVDEKNVHLDDQER